MQIVLRTCQILLAVAFLAAGTTKIVTPKPKLRGRMAWVDGYPDSGVKLVGVAEVLGALGLVLPPLFGILPILTPLAATGLAVVMIGAIVTHVRLHETGHLVAPAVLLVLAGLVAWGRFGPYHF